MIRLANDNVTALIDPSNGGRLHSLIAGGKEFIADVTDDIGEESESWYGGSFPLAPWAGRIPDGIIDFGGERHQLATGNGNYATHGLVSNREWVVDKNNSTSATISLHSDSSPWEFTVRQQFELSDDRLTVALSLTALTPMPCALGFHPWFVREEDGSLPQVEFVARSRIVSASGISEDDVYSDDLGSVPRDDLFVGVQRPPVIRWRDGRTLEIISDAPIWVVYERHPGGFCIEPWTATPHAFSIGADKLDAGETRTVHCEFAWN